MSNMTFSEMQQLAAIDALIQAPHQLRALTRPVVGVQVMAGIAFLLFNDLSGSTRCWVTYDLDEPVTIRERGIL